jgi:hypothetical protein
MNALAIAAGAAVTAFNLKETQVFRGRYLVNGLVSLPWTAGAGDQTLSGSGCVQGAR